MKHRSSFLTYILALFLISSSVPAVHAQKIMVGSCTLRDGAVYTGELVGGKPNGKGRAVYSNGDTYEGEFVKGLRHGEGTFN